VGGVAGVLAGNALILGMRGEGEEREGEGDEKGWGGG